VVVDEQAPDVTVRVTVLIPVVLHETLWGPPVAAVAELAPDPKFHAYVDPGGAEPANTAAAVLPMQTLAGSVKFELGGATTFTVWELVPGKHNPEVGATVKLTL
jgi:hypothetical protein